MTTGDARAELADALSALGETLRHHRDLGFTEADLSADVLLGPAEALAAQEKAAQGCRKCKLCGGAPPSCSAPGTRGRNSSSSARARAPMKTRRDFRSSAAPDSSSRRCSKRARWSC